MPRFGMKALLALMAVNRSAVNRPGRKQPDWDRIIMAASICVTVALAALFVYGKATARW